MDALPPFTGRQWLNDLVRFSARNNVCTKWGCTTCGARPFRKALLANASSAAGAGDQEIDEEIARQLANVDVDDQTSHTIRFVILFLYYLRGRSADFESDLLPLFARSPAGGVYQAMLTHYSTLQARPDPAVSAKQRELRARRKQERLTARQLRKAEIDAAWRARGKRPPPPTPDSGDAGNGIEGKR